MTNESNILQRWYLSAQGLDKGLTIDANGNVVEREDYFTDTRCGPEVMRRADLFFALQEKPSGRFYQRSETGAIVIVFDLRKTDETHPPA